MSPSASSSFLKQSRDDCSDEEPKVEVHQEPGDVGAPDAEVVGSEDKLRLHWCLLLSLRQVDVQIPDLKHQLHVVVIEIATEAKNVEENEEYDCHLGVASGTEANQLGDPNNQNDRPQGGHPLKEEQT